MPNSSQAILESSSPSRIRFDLSVVVAASLVATLPFCNKAFHIDDPLYLSIAEQILVDPRRPFDGPINWQQVTEPAWSVSISPPAFSYWLAIWLSMGVRSELGLHLAGTGWVVLLGFATYAWARRLGDWPVCAALLVVTGPLVVAGQNLMLDVPMLALAAGAIACYLTAVERNSVRCAVAAGVVAGLAVNVKYAGLVASVVMGVDAVVFRRWRLLPAALTGVAILGAGQLASAMQYGTPQLVYARQWITRLWPSDWTDVLHRTSSAVMFLGASAAWPVLLAGRSWRCKWTLAALPLVVLGAAATVLDVRARERESTVSALAHAAVFAFSGGLLLTCVTVAFAMRCGTFTRTRAIAGGRGRVPCETLAVLGASPPQPALQTTAHAVMLAVWTAGFWYLGTVNGPFVAPRALLPCVLSLVLALVTLFPRAAELGRAMPWATVAVTAVCGLLVGAADSQWAGIYRTWAPHLAEKHRPAAGTLYFLGHWGWQHYAQAAGMQQFDAARTRLQPGDLVVLPANVDCPLPIDRVLRGCQVVASDVVPSSPWLPRTRNPQGLIFLHGDTRHGRIPWGWSAPDAPEEVFVVFRYGG